MLFVLLIAIIVLFTVTTQYVEDDAYSTHHLACADYSFSIELHNFAEQEPSIPLHNHFVSKHTVIAMHNFYSGQG